MNRTISIHLLGLSIALLFSYGAMAQQGGCVFAESAPIYASSDGDKVEFTAVKGDCVAGVDAFEKKNNRIHVMYFPKKEQKGVQRTAWMAPSDLSFFDYECTCEDRGKPCSPLLRHFATSEWNDCFKSARDKKLAEGARVLVLKRSVRTGQVSQAARRRAAVA